MSTHIYKSTQPLQVVARWLHARSKAIKSAVQVSTMTSCYICELFTCIYVALHAGPLNREQIHSRNSKQKNMVFIKY